MVWLNSDGLLVKFGHEEGIARVGGHYNELGDNAGLAEVKLVLTDLATGSVIAGGTDFNGVIIPRGAHIEEIEIVTETAATSGGAAALNIGLVRLDRTTAYDADGLVAALALTAIDAVGEKTVIRVGSTGAGALLGTVLVNAGVLVADYDTAAYTAGKIAVRVKYHFDTTIG